MKLEGVNQDALYSTSDRDVYFQFGDEGLEHVGRIPNPCTGLDRFSYDLKTGGYLGRLRRVITGTAHSVNVWIVDQDILFANATNHLFRSRDGGQNWKLVKKLHSSSGIRGVLPNGLCYHEGTLYISEYIFDESRSPRIYASDNLGETWRTELTLDGVRHVHAVQPDPYTGDLWVATGDRDTESKIGRLVDGQLKVLGTGSQRWRAVELVFTPGAILWGTDCPYQENHVMKVERDQISENPDPESLFTVDDPFYYSTAVEVDGERIVLFSTGGGFMADSTAPDEESQSVTSDRQLGVYGSSSETDFSEWHRLASYAVKKRLANRLGRHGLTSNAYVFLDSSPELGVFVNPINTAVDDGRIRHVSSDAIATVGLRSAFQDL